MRVAMGSAAGGEERRLIWVDEGSGKGRRRVSGVACTAQHSTALEVGWVCVPAAWWVASATAEVGWGRWGRTHCLPRAHLAA